MRLTIELDDDALAAAVNKEVSKALAKLAEGEIAKQIEGLISKKVDRVNVEAAIAGLVGDTIKTRLEAELKSAFGVQSWNRSEAMRRILTDTAEKIIREAMKEAK